MAMKRKVEDEEVRMLRDVPKGTFVRPITLAGKPTKRVYRLEEYDRSMKGYWLQSWDDCSNGYYAKSTAKVLVGFTF